MTKRIAIIIYGPPGSGKGTQGNILASKLGVVHFDSGKFLETIVHDPSRKKEKRIRLERKNFETGKLMTPSFVLREVKKEFERFGRAGLGIVSSGSPRTLYEAKGEIPILEKYYGKKNIFVFTLSVPTRVSIARNSKRLICRMCGSPVLLSYYPTKHPTHCPLCGGKLYHRSLDTTSIIPVRIEEYNNRTKPIFDFMKKRGYTIYPLDGKLPPYKVFEKIVHRISPRKYPRA